MNVIELDNVSKVYGAGDTTVSALAGVSTVVPQGAFCAIMGASGSGKSTAMNLIGCLDRPTTGRYLFDGQDVTSLPNKDLASIRNRKIGFVFQQFYLLQQLSAVENVMLPLVYAKVAPEERRQRAVDALERLGLANRLNNRPNQLSGGQQQRVAIARAIVNKPLLLLADEPTGALDSRTTEEVLTIFKELHEAGNTIVMVTHEDNVAERAERVLIFRDGLIIDDRRNPGR
ncbi:MAG: ABC transporter ATP-binding protein [Candidatus Sericytochromatia bacterium]|nr:ABC transporter ATP-binding protein [Candidatus Sericytochromatia bacterium]